MDTGAFDLECRHSRFPLSSGKVVHNTTFQSLSVDTQRLHYSVDDVAQDTDSRLLRAWAVLLHVYVRYNPVCFEILPSLSTTDDLSKIEQYVSSNGFEVTIARCQVGTGSNRAEGAFDFKLCRGSDLRMRRSNAGFVISERDSFDHESDGESEIPHALAQIKWSIQHLDLILYLDKKRSQMFLLFRHPSISHDFAYSIRRTFNHILERSAQMKHHPLNGLFTLPPSISGQILAWNPTGPFSLKRATCLHHLIEEVVQRLPEADAICAWDGSLNYRNLNALGDVAAERLRRHGVKPGTYVPFAYAKSMWTIVACLGILKAGGAFVPIGIHEPGTRLLAILKSIDARVLVTSRQLEAKFRAFVVDVLVVDASTMEKDQPGTRMAERHSNGCYPQALKGIDHQREVQPADPVFVLFTSGSTGKPKGMIHVHESICTQWLLQGKLLGYHGARVLQFAAHTFDVFIIDVFTALLYGGCVCIPSEDDRQNNIVGVINKMKVDYATLTPSFAGLIEPCEVPTLKTLAIGGEALPQDRVQRWAEKVRFIQIYGPAEVGICLAVDMKPDTFPETVGFPLPNCSCWLVDPGDSDCLVPIGATGELVVAGPSLAVSYLNDDAKTQTCFISSPLWAREMGLPFTRFYRTGDLLRLNTVRFDGSYDFIGRKDSQIKLRGQRIEPGEVEYHLGKVPGVAHAMVTKPESGLYAGQLVAVVQTRIDQGYFQTHSPSQIPISAQPKLSLFVIRETLSKLMPRYMVPSVYLEVDALPCVPSMKIDRNLVRGWINGLTGELSLSMTERFPVISEEGTARSLSRAVSDLLEQKHGSQRRQDFTPRDFVLQDIGIDSIQVISFAMLIKKNFGVKVPPPMLIDPSTTIRHLADYIDCHARQNFDSHVVHTNGVNPKSFDLVHEVESLCEELKESLDHSPLAPVSRAGIDSHLQPRNIFLTGATGFLGIVILYSLLERYRNTNIYALIRCSSEHAGLLRLLQALDSQGRWKPTYLSRLFVIPGDLNREDLGISAQNLSMLQMAPRQIHSPPPTTATQTIEIDTIIHAAAKVHYSTSYTALKQTNTFSVLYLLSSFARVPSMKRFIYLSGGEQPHTSASLADNCYVHAIEEANGYTQSKVVGEQLVQFAAIKCGLNGQEKSVRIVKPGYMIGSAERGVANQSDFLWRLVRGCLEIGAYDLSAVRKWVFVGDVEYLAALVIRGCDGSGEDESNSDSVEEHESRSPVERVLCGVWFEDIWAFLKHEFGYTLDGMQTDAWMEELTKAIENGGEEHLLFPLLDTLEKEGRTVGVEWQPTGSDDDSGRAREAIRKNIEHLIKVGFLPAPGDRTRS